MIQILILILFFFLSFNLIKKLKNSLSNQIDFNDKFIVISGCDSGLGYQLAIELDQQGFHVIAGLLNYQQNHKEFNKKLSSNSFVYQLDLTKEEQIQEFYQQVYKRTDYLFALINNSGIMINACIDWTPLEIYRKVMEINYFGHVYLTKLFLPLLIKRKNSKLINIISAAGFFTFPFTSAYSSSKSAMKSFSDCLRREMSPWNLNVSIIEPGALKTPMMNIYQQTWIDHWNQLTIDVQQRWGKNYFEKNLEKIQKHQWIIGKNAFDQVIQTIKQILIQQNYSLRFRPDWQSQLIFLFLYLSPTWFSDRIISLLWNEIPQDLLIIKN